MWENPCMVLQNSLSSVLSCIFCCLSNVESRNWTSTHAIFTFLPEFESCVVILLENKGVGSAHARRAAFCQQFLKKDDKTLTETSHFSSILQFSKKHEKLEIAARPKAKNVCRFQKRALLLVSVGLSDHINTFVRQIFCAGRRLDFTTGFITTEVWPVKLLVSQVRHVFRSGFRTLPLCVTTKPEDDHHVFWLALMLLEEYFSFQTPARTSRKLSWF